MSYLLFILLLFSPMSFSQVFFHAERATKTAGISDTPTETIFKSFDYEITLPKNDCSKKAVKRFKNTVAKKFLKAISSKDKNVIEVRMGKKQKKVSDGSELGVFIRSFTDEIMVLKKETDILCKK